MALTPYQIRTVGDAAIKNLIINGNFDFWQRGTSFTSIADSIYYADRFRYQKSGTTSLQNLARVTEVPTFAQSGFVSTYSMKITQTATTDVTVDAGDRLQFNHFIEGNDYVAIHRKSFRLQFWVRASIAGNYGVGIANGGSTRSYVSFYTINAANTWEKKTIDVPAETVDTDYVFDTGRGLRIDFPVMLGSNFQAPPSTNWQTTAGVVAGPTGVTYANLAGTSGATWQITQIAVIPGKFDINTDLPFKRAGDTIQSELAMCQRYYESSGGSTSTISSNDFVSSAHTGAASKVMLKWSVEKRAVATITTRSDAATTTGTSSMAYSVNGVNNYTDGTIGNGSNAGCVFSVPSSNATSYVRFGWIADAEL